MVSSLDEIVDVPEIFIISGHQGDISFSPNLFYIPPLDSHLDISIKEQLQGCMVWALFKNSQNLMKLQYFPLCCSVNLECWTLVFGNNNLMLIKGRFQILKGFENNHVTIGFGSYGQVKLARDIITGNIVAVKVINKIAKNEIIMHNGLTHPKIIKLIDVYIDIDREITYMMLQYADGGTLFEKLKTEQLSKRDIRSYFRDVCEALAYLHRENIMHRDIKPQNILLNKNNEAKLCDFGFAAILGERKTLCGTYQYMSPEMIQNRPYDYKIDIWALGILYFEMISGHAPFRGDKPQEVLQQMKTKIYFCQRFEQEDINLIKMILRVTPAKRPTIQQILDQPILKEIDQKETSTYSTAFTEDEKNKVNRMQQLGQTYNPKRMAELQKNIEKQTYPPIYAPKANHKMAIGVTIPNEQNQVKSVSPLHTGRTFISTLHNMHQSNQMAYKPISQPGPSPNTSLTGTIQNVKLATHPTIQSKLHPQVQQFGYHPSNPFGRFS